MNNTLQGYTMLLDMYYYRKRLMSRYRRIKYFERKRIVKGKGIFSELKSVFTNAFKFFEEEEEQEYRKGISQIPMTKNPPPPPRRRQAPPPPPRPSKHSYGKIRSERVKYKGDSLDNWDRGNYDHLQLMFKSGVMSLPEIREVKEFSNIDEANKLEEKLKGIGQMSLNDDEHINRLKHLNDYIYKRI